MKVFTGGRECGKTQKAIDWAVEHDAYIVCHSKQQATYIFHRAKKQGKDIHFPMTSDELLGGRWGPGVKSIVFDNVDLLLQHLAKGTPVVGFTATESA